MSQERLPLRYCLLDGEPKALLPYEWIAQDGGELERVKVDLGGDVQGLAVWLERQVRLRTISGAAEVCGIDEAIVRRWVAGGYTDRTGWHPIPDIALATIDAVLTRAGEALWELYPYLDAEVEIDVVYCHRCREEVMPVDGVCPWCETETLELELDTLPEAHPRRRHVRRRRAKLRTVRRLVPGRDGWVAMPKPDVAPQPTAAVHGPGTGQRSRLTEAMIRTAAEAFCVVATMRHVCDEVEGAHGLAGYASSAGLYGALVLAFKRRGWGTVEEVRAALDAGELMPVPTVKRRSRLTEHLIYEAAWRYYLDEWGFDRIARLLYPLCPRAYVSYKGLAAALYDEFCFRGWPRRDRVQATRLASYKHGLKARDIDGEGHANYRRWLKHERGNVQPRCRGTVTQGKRKGKRCLRPAVKGQTLCAGHLATEGGDELRARRQREHLEAMWAKSHASEIPLEPFAVYLEQQCARLGSRIAVARLVAQAGGKVNSHQTFLAIALGRRRATVRRDTVERYLAAIGDGTTVERLYAPFLRGEDVNEEGIAS